MTNSESLMFSCPDMTILALYSNEFSENLPADLKKRYREIAIEYIIKYGPEGTMARLNGRTLSQILAEYQPGESQAKVIASGEVDGVRYTLYEPSNPDA